MLEEEKLREIMRYPDEDKQIQETVRLRLLKQEAAVAAGELGRSLDEALRQLD